MTDFLSYGDTERSRAMRHELPVSIGDPFLLASVDGRMHITVSGLERAMVVAAAPDAVLHDIADLGFHKLLEDSVSPHEIDLELASRGAAAMGIRTAVADPEIPVAIADRLRSDGITVQPDHAAIAARRRVKSAAELAGIRRAQAAAELGSPPPRRCCAERCPTAIASCSGQIVTQTSGDVKPCPSSRRTGECGRPEAGRDSRRLAHQRDDRS